MRSINLGIGILTVLLLMSTAICGFWLKANNINDPSAIDFHMKIASAATVFGVLSAIILIRIVLRK